MLGHLNGFRGIVQRQNPSVKFNHCIIHRQALASKDLSVAFENVMNVTVNVVNFVKARDLNARLFKKLCEENDSEFDGLLFHNTVHWLSRGKTLKRVFVLIYELSEFLTAKKHAHASKFSDPHFLAQLAFLGDIFTHELFEY